MHSASSQLCPLFQNVEDDALFDLVLQRHLLPLTVSAPIFPRLGDFLLIGQQADESETPAHLRIETAVNELQEAGYQAEAGTLLMRHRATHPALRTFDAAYSVLARLFRHWVERNRGLVPSHPFKA